MSQSTAAPLEAVLDQLPPFGLYQRYMVLMLCVPNLLAAMYSLNYIFVADAVAFRCLIPECETPTEASVSSELSSFLPDSRCIRHPTIDQLDGNGSCVAEDFDLDTTIQCTEFVYENKLTTYGEFNMACREWLRTLVGSIRNMALPVALILTGYISDSYGRRTAFCIFAACAGTLGIIKGFSVNYQMYVTFEFFEAALGYGFNSAGYVMMLEIARPSLRASFACATGVAYGLGGVLFALLSYLVPYWRHLLWTIHTPALLLTLYWLMLDESPRWLYSKGKVKQAVKVIRKAARWNHIILNEDLIKALDVRDNTDNENKSPNPWLDLLKSKPLVGRLAACAWCWIASTFVYYGLTINSVSLSGDKHVNFALNMAMEIVASLLLMMTLDRFGRRRCILVAFLLCGIACVVPFFVIHRHTGLGLFFLGKLSITFAFNSVYVFTAEVFPTSVRSSALAACSLIGRIGSILAPQTPLLSTSLQAILYGACSISAAFLVLLIPESRCSPLPADRRDAEGMKTNQAAAVSTVS